MKYACRSARRYIPVIIVSLSILAFVKHAYCGDEETTTLAIFDFTNSQGLITDVSEKLTILAFAELSKDDKIKLIERSEINKVMEEQDLSQSGLAKQDSLKLGKLLGAQNILTGKTYYMDDKVYFNVKLSNCVTGNVSGVSKSFDSKGNLNSILESFSKEIAKHIAEKIRQAKKDKDLTSTEKDEKGN